jgi:hypothetical protein
MYTAPLDASTTQDSTGIDLRIRVVDTYGNASDMIVAPAFTVGPWSNRGTSNVGEDNGVPSVFALHQNFPNPFNPSTTIRYSVPGFEGQGSGTNEVRLMVYDLLGREVALLANEGKAAGEYEVTFDGAGLSSGVYFYRLTAGTSTSTRKMLLVR